MASLPELLPTFYAPAHRQKILNGGLIVSVVIFGYLSITAVHHSATALTFDAFWDLPLILAATATTLFVAKHATFNAVLRKVAMGGLVALVFGTCVSFAIAVRQAGFTTVLNGNYQGFFPHYPGAELPDESAISPALVATLMGVHVAVWLGLVALWVTLSSVGAGVTWRAILRAVQVRRQHSQQIDQRIKIGWLILAGLGVCAVAIVPIGFWVTATDRSGLPSLLVVIVAVLLFAAVRQTCTHPHVPTTAGVVGIMTMVVGTILQGVSGAVSFAARYSAERGEYFDWPTFWAGAVTSVLGGGGLADLSYSDFFFNAPVSVLIFTGSQWVVLFGVCVLSVAMWRTLRADRMCCARMFKSTQHVQEG